jgi:hypothetical protein
VGSFQGLFLILVDPGQKEGDSRSGILAGMSRKGQVQLETSALPASEIVLAIRPSTSSKVSRQGKTLPVPKEHGAWFMLGHCLLIGAFVAGSFSVPVLLIILACVLTFMAMQGLKQLARAIRRREHGVPVRLPRATAWFLAGAVLTGAAVVLGWNLGALVIWGILSIVITAAYAWVLLRRKERSVLGEWLGISGLTLSAGAVWTAGTSRFGVEGLILWGLAFLYFGGTVPYVRLRVKQMKAEMSLSLKKRIGQARNALVYSVITLAAVTLAAITDIVPFLAVLPFVVSLLKVLWTGARGEGPRKIAHVGYGEAVFSTLFAVLTIAAFWPRT